MMGVRVFPNDDTPVSYTHLDVYKRQDMYDVVKFRVGIPGKKVTALTLAAVAPAAGADVYLLPYSTQKDRSFTAGKVKEADKISGNYSYYTLDMRLKDKMVSCPLMTVDGQVFGLAQK